MKVFIHKQFEREVLAVINCLSLSQAENFAANHFGVGVEITETDKGLYHVFNKTEEITLEGAENAAH